MLKNNKLTLIIGKSNNGREQKQKEKTYINFISINK